jgi:hypothetical protein
MRGELSTMVQYDIPQAWAAAFDSEGFDGIDYRTRFNTGAATTGVALFDDGGAHDWDGTRLYGADHPPVIAVQRDAELAAHLHREPQILARDPSWTDVQNRAGGSL